MIARTQARCKAKTLSNESSASILGIDDIRGLFLPYRAAQDRIIFAPLSNEEIVLAKEDGSFLLLGT
jgi:hypothetical protein